MNKVFLIGNLTADPELNTAGSDVKVAKMTLAVNNIKGDANFFRVIVWRTTAENVFKYCHKGDKIAINGYLQQNQYTDKDGIKRSTIDIIAETVEFINVRQNTAQEPSEPAKPNIHDPEHTNSKISQMRKEIEQAYRAARESRLATEQAHKTEEDDNLPF